MNIVILAAITDIARETGEKFGFSLWMFLSQVISFVIVALLLRRFAYKPILAVLEQRRQQIAEAQLELRRRSGSNWRKPSSATRRFWPRPTPQAQKMIDEARESATHVAERKQQEAVAAAEQIMAKAREASAIEHERTMTQLKRELGRLVVDTTAKVTGKVLNSDDQRRLQEEAARQIAS